MADFFDKSEDKNVFKIGDEEYTPEELESLVQDGKFKRDIETKQNTKLDKVFSEYTKLTQEREKEKQDWEKERQEYLEKINAKQEPAITNGNLDEATIARAREEARKIGLLTEQDLQDYVGQNFPKYYASQRAAEKLLDSADSLEKDINGSDGRPKFVTEEILQYMQETGFKDPLKAYKDKYEKELDDWKATELAKSKRDGIVTDSSSSAGSKQPAEVKPSKDNIAQLLKEALESA